MSETWCLSISGSDVACDDWFPQTLQSLHDSDFVFVSFRIIPNVAALKIKREKISKQDVAFMKKVEYLSYYDCVVLFLQRVIILSAVLKEQSTEELLVLHT